MSRETAMFAEERHQAITEIVRKHRRIGFAELQQMIDVSPATLRRDLTELEQAGKVIRVHGGVLDPSYVRLETSFSERAVTHNAAKKAIAAAAAAMVLPGSTVLIDAGSTCLEAGKALLGRRDVRIITHSAALLQAAMQGEAEVLCVGGSLRRVSGALVGAQALASLSLLRGDIAFLGATALEAGGCFTTELTEAEIKAAMIAGARRRILLADFSKWEQSGPVRFAEWTQLTDCITDKAPPESHARALEEYEVKVHRSDG